MNAARIERWADALNLTGDERIRFFDLASLTHAPAYLVQRMDDLIAENRRLKLTVSRSRTRKSS